MSKVKFKLNHAGVKQLLQSSEAQSVVSAYASQRIGRLGAGYETETFVGFDRAHAVIKPVTHEARRDTFENNSLLKAIGGG